MRFLLAPLLLAALVYGGWPYFEYYRLDQALAGSDTRGLEGYLDLEAIRAGRARASELQLQREMPGQDTVSGVVREGARLLHRAAAGEVTAEMIRERLRDTRAAAGEPARSLVARTKFAFLESPTRFVARLGALEEAPIYIEMTQRDWRWRVTGVYGCGP
jgi:hypothetical protein